MAILSARISDETRHLLQKMAECAHLPVGVYVRCVLENHVYAPLQDDGNVGRNTGEVVAPKEVEEASKGRPTHRLTYDAGRTSPWMIGPYPCDIKLFRQDDGDGCEKVGLLLEIFHEMGNPAKRTSSSITSTFNGCHKVPATPTYAEAVEAINAHKSPMEQFLRCHFDLSALADAEKILTRWIAAGEVNGGKFLERNKLGP